MMSEGLKTIAAGEPAILEAGSELSRDIYQKLGFEVISLLLTMI